MKKTKNRPQDEHRLQVKYGKNLKSTLEFYDDPRGELTSVAIGIDLSAEFFVGVDPRLHNPCRMSTSIEFKKSHVENIRREGWHIWNRARRSNIGPATEMLVGAELRYLLDYILACRSCSGGSPADRAEAARHFFLRSARKAA